MSEELRSAEVPGDVPSVVQRITAALGSRGVEVFATIDHAAGARAAGLELDDEVLLVFGNPTVGTVLMQTDPRAGLDLPLRLLVWSQDGTTRVAYRDPATLAHLYDVGSQQPTLTALRGLLDHLVAVAGGGSAPAQG